MSIAFYVDFYKQINLINANVNKWAVNCCVVVVFRPAQMCRLFGGILLFVHISHVAKHCKGTALRKVKAREI